MKKAIITGATGLVGMALSKYLSSNGVETLCLGRQDLRPEEVRSNFGIGSHYLRLAMEDIKSLPEQVDLIKWKPGLECVFFNFAWRGQERLTDGSFGDQVNNAVHAAEAVRSAKKIGCIKFVNVGTLEETFAEQFLSENKDQCYPTNQMDYALAKLASRDMCNMVSYLEKIDYVHTRFSIPLDPHLSRGTYVAETLKKIYDGKFYEVPKSKQQFDIIFIDDLVRAYYLIGLHGINKANYFIGTSRPATLAQYFEHFAQLVNGNNDGRVETEVVDEVGLFDTKNLYQDTGFFATTRFRDIFKKALIL
jgi:nucleoside-diphosphate-sugar epimerase